MIQIRTVDKYGPFAVLDCENPAFWISRFIRGIIRHATVLLMPNSWNAYEQDFKYLIRLRPSAALAF